MPLLNASSALIRPAGFFLVGFQSFPWVDLYFVFLSVVYALTLVSNVLLLAVIAAERALHTPKFLAVANLALVDVVLNSSTVPGMIKAFLLRDAFVPFDLCLLQMFFYYAFGTLESFALAVLAYDRLVAICFPLRHNAVNTPRSMLCVLGASWAVALGVIGFSVGVVTRLSFCGELRVFSYFCDYAPVFRLACNDYSLHWSTAAFLTFLLLALPFLFILLTYAAILGTVLRMKSLDSRRKALATCAEHVALVAVFYVPLVSIFAAGFFARGAIDGDRRSLCLSLASCLPPCVNPIVYSLSTKEIKGRALALLRRSSWAQRGKLTR